MTSIGGAARTFSVGGMAIGCGPETLFLTKASRHTSLKGETTAHQTLADNVNDPSTKVIPTRENERETDIFRVIDTTAQVSQ